MASLLERAKTSFARARERSAPLDVGYRVVKRYSEDDAGTLAAALTYYTFFSLFPILLAGAAILGYLTFGNETLRRDIIDAGVDAFPLLRDILKPSGLKFIEERRQEFAITGIILAIYAGSGAIVSLEHALNRVHRVVEEGSFVRKRLKSLAWLAALGGAAVLTVGLGMVAAFAQEIFPGDSTIGTPIGIIGGTLVNFLLFLVTFRFLPVHPRPVQVTIPGAIFGAIAFELLTIFGSAYLALGADSRAATFGALATAAGLLVACYLLAQIVLYSAELNAVLAERRGHKPAALPLHKRWHERSGDESARINPKGGDVADRTDKTSAFSGNGRSGEKSAGQLMKEVTEDLSTLIRKEVELAKQEIGQSVSEKVKGGVIVGIAATLAFFALIFVLLMVRDTLDDLIGVPGDWVWLADLLTAVLLLAIGGLGALIAKKKLSAPISTEMTKKTIKEDVEWAKTLTKR